MDNIVTTLSGGIDLLYSEEEEFLERVGENIDFDIFDLPRDIKKTVKDVAQKKGKEIKQKLQQEPFVRLRDEIAFLLGVVNLAVTSFLLGKKPEWIPMLYTIKFVVLVGSRVYLYKRARFHYFLLDFCYFANVMLLAYLHFFPQYGKLFVAVFIFSNGPLAWAIVTWRNSLVFHSLDKITSLFIHIDPPITTFVLRWWISSSKYNVCTADCNFTWGDLAFTALPFYFIWQIAYFVKVELLSRQKIQHKDYMTSRRWLSNNSVFQSLVKNVRSDMFKAFLFMAMSFLYAVLTSIPTKLLFDSEMLHMAFLISCFVASAWNGGTFYIEVFSRKYMQQFNEDRASKQH